MGSRTTSAGDEFITPERIQEAAALVRDGEVISFQLPLDEKGLQTGTSGGIKPVHQIMATDADRAGALQ